MLEPAYAIVDWGTSSFRSWVVDASGGILSSGKNDHGMSAIKREDFTAVLEGSLAQQSVPQSVPVVICGMAGAAQGWVEAPYVEIPTQLHDIHQSAVKPADTARNVWIIPGLAQKAVDEPDVMRGEETLLYGAQLLGVGDGVFCMPGTHSKWAFVSDGRVESFQTSMTGEVFALLAKQSTLAPFVSLDGGCVAHEKAFSDAVSQALVKPHQILRSLFSLRAEPLLFGALKGTELKARLSGLLIGLEIAGLREQKLNHVMLISSGQISDAYVVALKVAKLSVEMLDAEDLVRAGLTQYAKQIVEQLMTSKRNQCLTQ